MKKKIFKVFGLLSVLAILTLNVNVVMNGESSAVMKWDLIGKILAQDTSGSAGGTTSGCDECVYQKQSKNCTRIVFNISNSNGVKFKLCSCTGTKIKCPSGNSSCEIKGCDCTPPCSGDVTEES